MFTYVLFVTCFYNLLFDVYVSYICSMFVLFFV
jgi:hypothetical protein